MALQINKQLTSKGGLTIPSGAVVHFDTLFPQGGTEMHCNLFIYKDAAAFIAAEDPIYPKELDGHFGIVKSLSPSDYNSLTPSQVHIWLKSTLDALPSLISSPSVISIV